MNDTVRMEKPGWWLAMAIVMALVIYGSSMSWRQFDGDILEWRWQILMLTGIVTWVLLTFCMLIPLRWNWVERLFGGLDKGYEVHKWVGIAALCVVSFHWLTVQSWRWMVRWGWLDAENGNLISELVGRLGWGGSFPIDAFSRIGGGGAFFIMTAAVVVALVRVIPYHIFRAIHKMTPAIYLLATMHVVNRMPMEWWRTPAAYILLVCTLLGAYGAVISLRQAIGRKKRFTTTLVEVNKEAGDILDITLETKKPFIHKAGQFAFLDFTRNHHGGHPFSMASCDKKRIRFVIKKLGDFTNMLENLLELGQTVEMEGPYGGFDFDSPKPVQVWIAGGIGITPFIARLEDLAKKGKAEQKIFFWYSADEDEAKFPPELDGLCEKAGVTLKRILTEEGKLSVDDVEQTVGDLSSCSVWFCGPGGFGASMRKGLAQKGFSLRNFHSEEFEFR